MSEFLGLGARFRAVRVNRGWTQNEVAVRVKAHRSLVSRIERGHVRQVSIGTLLDVAEVLGMRVTIKAWWHGGDLERLVNGGHSLLHESVASHFAEQLPDWALAPEVSFAYYGERGVIDILAWHAATRSLLVIELKTDVVDINEMVGTLDRKRRHAAAVARERGWDPVTVSCWVIVAGGGTNGHRLARHRSLLRNAYPTDGRAMHGWVRRPTGAVAAISIWERAVPDGPLVHGGSVAARHRVRRKAIN